jgi:hypothetical protein
MFVEVMRWGISGEVMEGEAMGYYCSHARGTAAVGQREAWSRIIAAREVDAIDPLPCQAMLTR